MKQNVLSEELFIFKKMAEGDEDAFKYFFDTYYEDLCNFVNSYLRNELISEDIVQDIFIYFWENRQTFGLNHSVKSYLYTASKNRSLNYLRDAKNRTKTINKLAFKTDFSQKEQYMETEELRKIISKSIESLPPKCKKIYCLSRDNGMSNKEIASELGVSEKTVENQITIAIHKIKAFLEPYYNQLFTLFLISIFF